MMSCAHVDETEELALELLTDVKQARARAHLASCAHCRDVYQRFVEEQALFQRRAASMRPAPYLAPAVLEAIDSSRARGRIASASRVLIAIAACVAAITSRGWIGGGSPTLECATHSRRADPTVNVEPSWLSTATTTNGGDVRSALSMDEPLACAFPVSGLVHVTRSDEGLACVAVDRATCEERVTSSVATP